MHYVRSVFFAVLFFLLLGCNQKKTSLPVEYYGAQRDARDVHLLYSEGNQIKAKMLAKRILEFKNGNQEFPKGIYFEIYNSKGKLESTLKANHAFYSKKKNIWLGSGNVKVENIQKKQILNTEELFWNPGKRKIFTERFVTIQLENEVIYGKGLNADQDMKNYIIKKPKGDFEIKE